ncbi:MAG: hypothetical protein FWB98_01735 [Defluviitaleaceae bacterium]|nr:hypothetical protein [Defluviitaleaceae bacterium]
MIDINKAKRFFEDWEQICDKDNGELWGFPLHTPFMFIDDQRNIVANQPDAEGNLKPENGVYVGEFPENQAFAATATDFGGTRWGTMPWGMLEKAITGNIPSKVLGAVAVKVLSKMIVAKTIRCLIHEAIHCIQPPEMFEGESGVGHLNNPRARLLLLLEASALHHSLVVSGDGERLAAVTAALSARQKRELDFGGTAQEAEREICEGSAVFTEIMLGVAKEKHVSVLKNEFLASLKRSSSFTNLAGYCLGALYCFALDKYDIKARQTMGWDVNMAELLQKVAGVAEIPDFKDIDYKVYGLNEILKSEKKLSDKHNRMIQEIRDKFIEGSVLVLHGDGRASINGQMIHVEGLGLVMRGNVEYHGEVGKLVAVGGDVLKAAPDLWKVSAENIKVDGKKITGNNWEMELKDGYICVEGGKNWILIKPED